MNSMEGKVKKWIELIQKEKVEKIVEDIQATISSNFSGKINKHIFKLLLYLSHTADKCDKQNYDLGKEIHRLSCFLCSILNEVPDSNKFVSSLFHIIRCLLTMCMYDKAFEVCSYLKTDVSFYSYETVSDILVKVAYLWYNAVNSAFVVLQKDPFNYTYYYELKNIIKHELDIIQITYEVNTKELLKKISLYMDKISLIDKESNKFSKDFYAFVTEYLGQVKLSLNKDEKYIILRHMLQIVSYIMCENINERFMDSVVKNLDFLNNHFKRILKEDKECYRCFQEFESLCFIFMTPVDCLVKSNAKSIGKWCNNYVETTKKFEYTESIKWTTFSIVQVLESLFTYWETCIKLEKKMFLENGVLLETMNLIEHINICFINQTSNKCKTCRSDDCMVKRDIYNAIVIKMRCINLISKLSANDLSKDICRLARRFLEQNIAHIYEMKECKCKYWTHLWSPCSALIYNLGIISESYYEESVSLFSLLCTSIIQVEGIQSKPRYIKLKNPICDTLHRLSVVHYNNGMYREAMTTSALNALLSYNDLESKAFRMWTNIKHKSVTSKAIMDMTIVACLKADKAKVEELGLSIVLSQYDLVEICFREVKSLQKAKVNLSNAICKVLNEMRELKASPILCARVVQMLAYHLLHFDYKEEILDYLKQAISDLKQTKMSNSDLCLQANLEFYIFINQLHTMNKKTQIEMENTTFALHAQKVSEIGENESRNIVPTYTMINIKEDSRLMTYLQTLLQKWNKCLKRNVEEIAKEYDPKITLHTLVIAGEYAHLYHYHECEINIWELAYKLAFELQDNHTIIYVTGRSISRRNINHKWITTAKELVAKLKDTNDEEIVHAIAIFWISLSDFYFHCNMYNEARKLFDEFKKLPNISFISNIAVHLYGLDRILYNCYLYKQDIEHEEYTQYIVETLYTMIHLNEELSARRWKPQDKHLFDLDILLSATVNLSLRMNSLLSFREIGAHLVRRLKTAQLLGATIRVVEILKSLCYIDLSRSQLNDCEVKLQGMEHILNTETFKVSMNSNPVKVISENVLMTPIRIVDPIRDIPQNDASPILRNKVFDLPEFVHHTDCNCYVCQNVSYRYLVFISTHIRAQLYALQKNFTASLQHFSGAFKIKENLTKTEKYMSKNKNEYFSWQECLYSIDYVLLLINFASFLRNYSNVKRDKVKNIISLATQMCDIYKLKGHPIYMSVEELMFDERFQIMFSSLDYSTFTVPDPPDINISKYIQKSKVEDSICVTPTNTSSRTNKPITLRRNRTPPILKLTKVNMNFSDDEDDNGSTPKYRRTKSHSMLTRRKILDEEYSDNRNETKKRSREPRHKSFLEEFINLKKSNFNNVGMKDIVNKIASLVPDVSEHLDKIVEKVDEPVTNKSIQELIKIIEETTKATSQKQVRKIQNSKHPTSNDCNKINEIITFFKDLTVNEEKDNIDLSGKNDLISELNAVPDSSVCQKQCRISEKHNQERLNQNNLSVDQSNRLDNLEKTCVNENIKLRVTRNSTKHDIANKEIHNAKTRKSKEKSL